MVTISQLSVNLKALLKENNIEDYLFESRCILEHALKLDHSRLLLNPDTTLSDSQVSVVQKIAEKRISGYPLQYILGEWEFFGLPFYVGEGVLIPRQDTETLVETVLERLKTCHKPRIADLCSGSGCIAVALDKNNHCNADICAVEYSDAAMKYLTKNIELNSSSVTVYKGNVLSADFCSAFSDLDIIVSNPPYLTSEDMEQLQTEVSYEPEMALKGGSDGLLFYQNITALWKNCLRENGMIFYEIGIHQENDVSDILARNGFRNINTAADLSGITRVVYGVYKP